MPTNLVSAERNRSVNMIQSQALSAVWRRAWGRIRLSFQTEACHVLFLFLFLRKLSFFTGIAFTLITSRKWSLLALWCTKDSTCTDNASKYHLPYFKQLSNKVIILNRLKISITIPPVPIIDYRHQIWNTKIIFSVTELWWKWIYDRKFNFLNLNVFNLFIEEKIMKTIV